MPSDVVGVKELIKDFEKLEAATGVKIMRQAVRAAVKPVYVKIQAAAPVGRVGHRTYKGRLVAPGFSKRSLALRTRKLKGGRVSASVQLKSPEAFYGIQYYDQTSYTITSRKIKGRETPIKPYRLRAKNFFNRVFENSEDQMVDGFAQQLRKRINKI